MDNKDKTKWLNPSWIDSKVRNQFSHGAYGAQHNPDDVDKLVEAASNCFRQGGIIAFYEELEQALKAFEEEVRT